MFYLVKSGKYLSYVTPRMEPYLYFAAIVMGIWALAGLLRLSRPQHKIRSCHCFVLAIPVLFLLLPHSPLRISDLTGNYVVGNALSVQPTKTPSPITANDLPPADTESTDSADTAGSDIQPSVSEDENSAVLPGLDTANKKITVSNDDFSMWITELFTNMENYKGYTVAMTGYIFKDPELKKDEFVPARLMMSCCAADLSPTGLICKYDKASELKADTWVTVEGTLIIGQYEYEGEKYEEPQISVTEITPAEEVEGYVYPFY